MTTFTPKQWEAEPSPLGPPTGPAPTPINGAALTDLEQRVYAGAIADLRSSQGPELYDSWVGRPDGLIAPRAPTGQLWRPFGNHGGLNQIVGGVVQAAQRPDGSQASASYLQSLLANPVTLIGGRFPVPAWNGSGLMGSANMLVPIADYASTWNYPGGPGAPSFLPIPGMHVAVTPLYVQIAIFQSILGATATVSGTITSWLNADKSRALSAGAEYQIEMIRVKDIVTLEIIDPLTGLSLITGPAVLDPLNVTSTILGHSPLVVQDPVFRDFTGVYPTWENYITGTRSDTAVVTIGQVTVYDAAIGPADQGKAVVGANGTIPAATYVGTVIPGVSFQLSSSSSSQVDVAASGTEPAGGGVIITDWSQGPLIGWSSVWADSSLAVARERSARLMHSAGRSLQVARSSKPASVSWRTTDGSSLVVPSTTTDMAAANAADFAIAQIAQSGVTISLASPGVFTLANHGLNPGDAVVFTTTPGGALPTGIVAGTTYFVLAAGWTPGTFQVGASAGAAAINTSGAQSGTHTVTKTAAANPPLGNPTISIASPGVISIPNHGLAAGDAVVFGTTGALPTGIVAGTVYFVIAAGLVAGPQGAFQIATVPGAAAINTSGAQSGTHTVTRASFLVPVTPPLTNSGRVRVRGSAMLNGNNTTGAAVFYIAALRLGATTFGFDEVASVPAQIATAPVVPGSFLAKIPFDFTITGLTKENQWILGKTYYMSLQFKASAAGVWTVKAAQNASFSIHAESVPLP